MSKNTMISLLSCAAMSSAALAGGQTFTIADGNSSASFNSASGQISWDVDGVNQIFGQEFYYRRGGDSREFRVDDLNLNNVGNFTQDTNPFSDDRDDAFGSLFTDGNGLEIETLFTIRGNANGSGSADLAEQISIRNMSNSAITLSFFQFVDFDLGGDAGDDFGQIINGNTAQQSDAEFSMTEVVVTPQPQIFQMGSAAGLDNILNDGNIDDLDGTASFSGDVAWAFQWNLTLAAGDSFLISKNKSVVPTPGSAMLLGAAGLFAGRRRR
ncbi:MAG: hypothetical protein AB8C13_06805 [Phycisphaerales bacterium]